MEWDDAIVITYQTRHALHAFILRAVKTLMKAISSITYPEILSRNLFLYEIYVNQYTFLIHFNEQEKVK